MGAMGAVPGASGAVLGASGAVPGASGAVPGASGAVPGAAGAVPGAAGASGPVVPPPLPGVAVVPAPAESRGVPFEVLRVVRLAVSAARADGTLLPAERALILSHAREAGVESVVEEELASPRSLNEIVSGVTDAQRKRDLYVLAFTIVRADEHVSGAERIYLAQLAHQLGLDATATAALEADTASKIDAQPDTND
jgi:uncharacterized membrane protein YebE (DUF533 family)